MNFRHALGFFLVGAISVLIPRFAPGLCPTNGADGSSTQAIWLQIMSVLQMGLGLQYFAQRTLVGLGSLLEYTPRPVPAATPFPVRTVHGALAQHSAMPGMSPIRAAFKGGLMDQRRAA